MARGAEARNATTCAAARAPTLRPSGIHDPLPTPLTLASIDRSRATV
jgi:hypothetical protein